MADITLAKQKYDKEYRKKNKEKLQHKSAGYYTGVRKKAFIADPAKYLWGVAKVRAKQKGIDFNITPDNIIIPEFCPITLRSLVKGDGYHQDAMSLDRVDNSKGYVVGNVRVISRIANLKKSSLTEEDLIRMLSYIRREI